MFKQFSGTWPDLVKNIEKHKIMLMIVGKNGDMEGMLRNNLISKMRNKNPKIDEMLKVHRSPEHDTRNSDGNKQCAYLITLGNFDNNLQAKMLLEKEW